MHVCASVTTYTYVISQAPKTRHMTLEVQVRATLVARSSGAPSPTENSGSESPVEKALLEEFSGITVW